MSRATPFLVLGGVLLLGACAVPPPGPSVMALPGAGKNFDQFRRDDVDCRQYANQQTGYGGPAAAANQAGVGSALLGTGLGAAAGALIGAATGHAGAGAAIGAGGGLLLGSAYGANGSAASGAGLQAHYDMAYSQCMYGHGNRIPSAPAPYPYAYAPAYEPYPPPPPAPYGNY